MTIQSLRLGVRFLHIIPWRGLAALLILSDRQRRPELGISKSKTPTSFLCIFLNQNSAAPGSSERQWKSHRIMKKNDRKEELQSRRDFFRNAAKMALPVIGAIVLSKSIVVQAAEKTPQGCYYSCTAVCANDCSTQCARVCNYCRITCEGGCKETCHAKCASGCQIQCYAYCC